MSQFNFILLDLVHYSSLSRYCPNLNSISQDRVYPSELRVSLHGSIQQWQCRRARRALGMTPGAKRSCSPQIETEQMMGGGPIEDLVFKK